LFALTLRLYRYLILLYEVTNLYFYLTKIMYGKLSDVMYYGLEWNADERR